jgi:kumamolisin
MSCRVFFCIFSAATILCGHLSAAPTQARHRLDGHLSGTWKNLPPLGPLAATNEIRMAIGLQLRDPAGLEKFLADVYDPSSQNYRKFLTADELAARFGPTEADYEAVKQFALASGFKIAATHGNRLLLDVSGQAGDVERAFNFHLLRYRHPVQAREFFAPDAEPSVDVSLPVADIQGLSDFFRPYPRSRRLPAGNFSATTFEKRLRRARR